MREINNIFETNLPADLIDDILAKNFTKKSVMAEPGTRYEFLKVVN